MQAAWKNSRDSTDRVREGARSDILMDLFDDSESESDFESKSDCEIALIL